MDTIEQVKKNLEKWEDEITTRRERLQFINEQLPALVTAAIESKGTAQKEAQAKRTQYAAELETLNAEMPEVQRRHDEAKQAVKNFYIDEAQQAYDEIMEKFLPARAKVGEMTKKNTRLENWRALGSDAAGIEDVRLFRIEYANASAEFDLLSIEENKARKNLQQVRERTQ